MYFIRMHALKQQLRDRTLTDREALPYYLILTVAISIMPLMSRPFSELRLVLALFGTAISVLGVIYAYDQNGGRTGYDFIQKSVTLGWVLGIRMMALLIPMAIVMGLLKDSLGQSAHETSWVDIFFISAFTVFYYLRLGKHLKDTNKPDVEQRFTVCPDLPRGGTAS